MANFSANYGNKITKMRFYSPYERWLTRRALLQALALLGVSTALPLGLGACSPARQLSRAREPEGLRSLLNTRQYFGVAVDARHLADTPYAAAIAKHANILVPENDLKWRVIQPQAGAFNFSAYQKLAAFAQENNQSMRGHTLVWHTGLPKWAEKILLHGGKAEVRSMLHAHLQETLQQTATLVHDWDVVNEAVSPHSRRKDFLRANSPWFKALGPDYITEAFSAVHSLNPTLTLTYNDYSMEYADAAGIRRRSGVLQLLQRLKQQGVPIHQLGLQSHLQCHRPLAGKAFTDFLRTVQQLGIKIIVTELDLNLAKLSGTDSERLNLGAHYAATYLKMIAEVQLLDTIICWGLSTPYSFMTKKDRSTLHPLPLDNNLAPLPLWHAVRSTFIESV